MFGQEDINKYKLFHDSDDEKYFHWWLLELEEKTGMVYNINPIPEPYLLSEEVKDSYDKVTELKTKTKVEKRINIVLEEHIYTCDFKFKFTEEFRNLFVDVISTDINVHKLDKPFKVLSPSDTSISVEIKPEYDMQNMTRLFKINQKWVYKNFNEFVNLIQYKKLFQATFTPERYLYTDVSLKKRKINFNTTSLNDYLKRNKANK